MREGFCTLGDEDCKSEFGETEEEVDEPEVRGGTADGEAFGVVVATHR